MLTQFTCARFRLCVEAIDGLHLNAFAGATLRGGFGHVFKKTVCIWPPADCPHCLLRQTCSYPYIFETAPPPDAQKLRNLDQVPRPFVIEPPQTHGFIEPGTVFDFRLVLIGRAIDYLPYFVFTFQRLGELGLGRDLGRYRLVQMFAETSANSPSIFEAATGTLDTSIERTTFAAEPSPKQNRVRIEFLTPTRIKSDGSLRAELTFQDVVRALLRRLSSLSYFHCGRELQVDFRSLIEQASTVRTASSALTWHDQSRFSGRQRQRVEMGGVVGTVEYEVPDASKWASFWPLLKAGAWVHVGKGCVMGLGQYRVTECG